MDFISGIGPDLRTVYPAPTAFGLFKAGVSTMFAQSPPHGRTEILHNSSPFLTQLPGILTVEYHIIQLPAVSPGDRTQGERTCRR